MDKQSEALPSQLRQSTCSFVQSFRPLAESEPYLARPVLGIAIETRSGDAGDADLLHQMPRECDIVIEAKCGNIRHDVVRAAGTEALESRGRERGHEMVSAHSISFCQLRVVRGRQAQRRGAGLLQRRRSS